MPGKQPNFNSDFFRRNRERLREQSASAVPIVITANGALQSDSYSSFAFRQDSNFWYLTGINDPDIILVMDKSSEYLIVPDRNKRQVIFDGELDYDKMKNISGVDEILHTVKGWQRFGKRLKSVKKIDTLKPAPIYVSDHAMYSNPARRTLVRNLMSYNPELQIRDLRPQLTGMRMIKADSELTAIQFAIDHTVNIYKMIGTNLQAYKTEQAVAADVAHYITENQLGYAYEPIIAGGLRATVLHYNKNNAPLKPKEYLLLDIGAAAAPYYCADITRTVAVNPNKRMVAVYDAVLAVQQFAIDYLKPGIFIQDYEIAVNKLMGKKLLGLGLISDTEQGSIRQFYPHGTSHFMGLDVHDVGDYTKPLEPGMVLTVEPGIYIKEESIGIRIEDDIVITAGGNKVLTSELPKNPGSLTIS